MLKIFNEGMNIKDDNLKYDKNVRGHVIIQKKINGLVIDTFEKDNKVIVPGSAFTAMKHFKDLSIPIKTQTYNTALGLDRNR